MNIRIGEIENDIKELRRVAKIPMTPMYTTRERLVMSMGIVAVIKRCKREGWDDEGQQYERCDIPFKISSCKCHPDYCRECCLESHGISVTRPAVIEGSPIEHDCSAKGNY